MAFRLSIIDILYLYFGYYITKIMTVKTEHSTGVTVDYLTKTVI